MIFLKFLEAFSSLKEEIAKVAVQEIIIVNPNQYWVCANENYTIKNNQYLTGLDYQKLLEDLAIASSEKWNFSFPYCSFGITWNDHFFRLTLIHQSLNATQFSSLFLRKLAKKNYSLAEFGLNPSQTNLLKSLILTKKNLVICGGTGSGKTSFLQSLTLFYPPFEHVVVLEDTLEIRLNHPFLTHLIAEPLEGKNMSDLCLYTMRMRPERFILGEIRSVEVVPLLLLLNSGHEGLLTSIHANSASESLNKLAILFSLFSGNKTSTLEEGMSLICKNFHYCVFLKDKKVEQIVKVIGNQGIRPFVEEIWPSKVFSTGP